MKQKTLITHISDVHALPSLKNKQTSLLIDTHGNIEKIGTIEAKHDYNIVDAKGCILSPGWVDMHTHVYEGVCDIGINPDRIGPKKGVTVLVDAGSAGHINYKGFQDYVINTHSYSIVEFLNFGSIGISRCNVICDYETDDFIQPRETISCILSNKNHIRGVKVRACKVVLKQRGIEIVKGAKRVAREVGLPLMVHIGEPGPQYSEILEVLEEGDIVTHCFHGKPGNILDPATGRVIEAAIQAKNRGVLFDIGHGAASFDINISRACIEQGFLPDFIGSDLHAISIQENCISLPTTMSKMVASGLSSAYVLDCVTHKARKALGIEDFQGSSLVGKKADFTIFDIKKENAIYYDASGTEIKTFEQFCPLCTVVGTNVLQCE
jgi:dihydroorotase